MKKKRIILWTAAILSLLLMMPVTAEAARRNVKKSHRTAAAASTSAAKPCFLLQAVPFTVLPTMADADLTNPVGVKSVKLTVPVYDTDWENGDGEETTLTFNRDGKLTGYENLPGDAVGGVAYTVHYDSLGTRPAAIDVRYMEHTQDPCQPDEWIEATYDLSYSDGLLSGITERITSVWGKKMSATYHYNVAYDENDAVAKVTCREMPEVFFDYDGMGSTLSDGGVAKAVYYTYQCDFRYRTSRATWRKERYVRDPVFGDGEPQEEPADVRIQTDSHGNWVRKTWQEPSFYGAPGYETGLRRVIEYY